MSLESEIWLPPPDLTIAQWAENYRKIPPEAAAEPGNWHNSRAPYQKGMMEAISNERYERIVMMTAAQIGKTEIILNTLGYYIDKEPSPILLIYPTLEMGMALICPLCLIARIPLEPSRPQHSVINASVKV